MHNIFRCIEKCFWNAAYCCQPLCEGQQLFTIPYGNFTHVYDSENSTYVMSTSSFPISLGLNCPDRSIKPGTDVGTGIIEATNNRIPARLVFMHMLSTFWLHTKQYIPTLYCFWNGYIQIRDYHMMESILFLLSTHKYMPGSHLTRAQTRRIELTSKNE